MVRRFVCGALVCAACVGMAVPARATSAVWPLVEPAEILLEFEAPYTDSGVQRTHRGVDLAAMPGAAVLACASGVVTFAGAVPADGGGTVCAVTLALADGRRVSVLPLDDLTVSEGEELEAGAILGHASATGDGSTAEPHIHVGLRDGEEYLDPMSLLIPPACVITPPVPDPPQDTTPGEEPSEPDIPDPPLEPLPGIASPVSPVSEDSEPTPSGMAPEPVTSTLIEGGTEAVDDRPLAAGGLHRSASFVPSEGSGDPAPAHMARSYSCERWEAYGHSGAAVENEAHRAWWAARSTTVRAETTPVAPTLPLVPVAAAAASILAALAAAACHVGRPLASFMSSRGVRSLQTRSEGDRLLRLHILLRAYAFQSRGRVVQRR